MICARFNTDELPVIVGLTAEELKILRAGGPIHLRLESVGITGAPEIMIVYEPTEQHILDKLKSKILPRTKLMFTNPDGSLVSTQEGSA